MLMPNVFPAKKAVIGAAIMLSSLLLLSASANVAAANERPQAIFPIGNPFVCKYADKTFEIAPAIFLPTPVNFSNPIAVIIAVSIGAGMNEIFRELGADYLIEGGQTMNPSTEDMLEAIAHVNAEHIFILPNNSNIIMAANQAAALVEDKDIIVLPTKTIPQGIVALVNFIPDYSVEENKEMMLSELGNVKTGQVTYAVRDTEMDGMEIHENDYMGIGDHSILSAGTDLEQTTLEMIDKMMTEDAAIVSIYYGQDAGEEDAEKISAVIEEKYPDVEVEINNGGQPIYYYVISVE